MASYHGNLDRVRRCCAAVSPETTAVLLELNTAAILPLEAGGGGAGGSRGWIRFILEEKKGPWEIKKERWRLRIGLAVAADDDELMTCEPRHSEGWERGLPDKRRKNSRTSRDNYFFQDVLDKSGCKKICTTSHPSRDFGFHSKNN